MAMLGEFSIEAIVHFVCGFCGKRWAIFDADTKEMYACPHCKGRQFFKEANDECGRGGMADAPVSEAGSEKSGGSTPLDRTELAKAALQVWIDKQGHERCWYYPEIFRELCEIFGVQITQEMLLPPRCDFRKGCEQYEKEVYEQNDLLPTVPSVQDNGNGTLPAS